MKKSFWMPATLGTLLITGCGSNPETANQVEPKSSPTATNTPQSRTVASNIQLPSDPKEVVRLFLDSMRQGNGAQLSALLSIAAREEISRKKLEIDPLGSPQASFVIGDAAPQGESMLVSTTWNEPAQNGQPATELEVVWELRKEPTGWRIFCMAVDANNEEEIQVVNFERLEPEPPAPEQRMASLPNATPTPAGQSPTPQYVPQSLANGPVGPTQGSLPNAPPQGPQSPVAPSGYPQQPGQFNMPPVVPASVQLPPVQPSNFQQPSPNTYPSGPQSPNGSGFQLPPPTPNNFPR
ncbi:MAG: hypothetical protein ABL921_17460 [Pirellula sp.]